MAGPLWLAKPVRAARPCSLERRYGPLWFARIGGLPNGDGRRLLLQEGDACGTCARAIAIAIAQGIRAHAFAGA